MTLKFMPGLSLACAVQLASPALARDVALDYQAATHVVASRAGPVPGQADHRLGTGALRGVALMGGGEFALHRYQGRFDLKGGSGRYEGYAL